MIVPFGYEIVENELNPYYLIRHFIFTGDLLSWCSDGFVGMGVRFFTKGDVNHSSTAINSSEYGKGRKFCTEAMEMGCEFNSIGKRITKFKGKVYWHPLLPQYHSYRNAIGTAAYSRIGTDYDFKSIWEQIFGRVSINVKKLFCSEYVYLNMVDAKVPGAKKNIIAPNPHELYTTHQFWGNPILIKE